MQVPVESEAGRCCGSASGALLWRGCQGTPLRGQLSADRV